MPPVKKAPGTAINKRNGTKAQLVATPGMRFDPPADLCELALKQWDAYWDDSVSTVHTITDRGLLLRWITNVDRYLRISAEADREPVTQNSQGRVANPLYAIAFKIEASVKADEAQIGIGPKNRTALGIAVISQQKSLAEMNAQYRAEGNPVDDGDDPRLTIIEGTAV